MPTTPNDEDGFSLPAWIYRDPEFFELEKQAIFHVGAVKVISGKYFLARE